MTTISTDLIADMLRNRKDAVNFPAENQFLYETAVYFAGIIRGSDRRFDIIDFMARAGMTEDMCRPQWRNPPPRLTPQMMYQPGQVNALSPADPAPMQAPQGAPAYVEASPLTYQHMERMLQATRRFAPIERLRSRRPDVDLGAGLLDAALQFPSVFEEAPEEDNGQE